MWIAVPTAPFSVPTLPVCRLPVRDLARGAEQSAVHQLVEPQWGGLPSDLSVEDSHHCRAEYVDPQQGEETEKRGDGRVDSPEKIYKSNSSNHRFNRARTPRPGGAGSRKHEDETGRSELGGTGGKDAAEIHTHLWNRMAQDFHRFSRDFRNRASTALPVLLFPFFQGKEPFHTFLSLSALLCFSPPGTGEHQVVCTADFDHWRGLDPVAQR